MQGSAAGQWFRLRNQTKRHVRDTLPPSSLPESWAGPSGHLRQGGTGMQVELQVRGRRFPPYMCLCTEGPYFFLS